MRLDDVADFATIRGTRYLVDDAGFVSTWFAPDRLQRALGSPPARTPRGSSFGRFLRRTLTRDASSRWRAWSTTADGSYLTIAGSFGAKLPAGGGLNLAEISLNYDDYSVEYGSFLASFLGLGDNYVPGTEPNAIDGKLETHTTMGNNVDEPDKRLRVTLGFKSSLMPG